ncbi:hypothetical protein HT661_24330, partial [Halomonas titanicae]|nr:hypothetical protein [Halomonas titanicae]
NILRLMGQLGMTGELSPVRHPAKRRMTDHDKVEIVSMENSALARIDYCRIQRSN